jgi:hypothetical protein
MRGVAGHYGLLYNPEWVLGSRSRWRSDLATSEGCFPTVFPQAVCSTTTNLPLYIDGKNYVTYNNPCTGKTNHTEKHIAVDGCINVDGGFDLYYTMFRKLANDTGSAGESTQIHCLLSMYEAGESSMIFPANLLLG